VGVNDFLLCQKWKKTFFDIFPTFFFNYSAFSSVFFGLCAPVAVPPGRIVPAAI
jgi:hypothetical protein